MPYDDPEPDDPNMLVGVILPGDASSVREMAVAFADEFAALGFDESRLLSLFRQPFYAGPFQALQVLGEDEVRAIVRESVTFWGNFRVVVQRNPSGVPSSSHQSPEAHKPAPCGLDGAPLKEESCRK